MRTERSLDDAIDRWNPSTPPPRDVTLLALYEQRIVRRLGDNRPLGAAVARLAPGTADDIAARRDLATLAGSSPPLRRSPRVGAPPPATRLLAWYREAERRF